MVVGGGQHWAGNSSKGEMVPAVWEVRQEPLPLCKQTVDEAVLIYESKFLGKKPVTGQALSETLCHLQKFYESFINAKHSSWFITTLLQPCTEATPCNGKSPVGWSLSPSWMWTWGLCPEPFNLLLLNTSCDVFWINTIATGH